jgi:outer membrane protein assembly factor BamE (lipoprotein component of BamABCDE complex)
MRQGSFRMRSLQALALGTALALAACANPQPHGYVLSETAIEQIPVGSSQQQVLLVLGSPSTTSTVGGQAYYYISQTIDDNPVFGRSIEEQRVLAVYFDEEGKVREVANYGLQDGKIFDFISRRTRTGGRDLSFLGQLLTGVGRMQL